MLRLVVLGVFILFAYGVIKIARRAWKRTDLKESLEDMEQNSQMAAESGWADVEEDKANIEQIEKITKRRKRKSK